MHLYKEEYIYKIRTSKDDSEGISDVSRLKIKEKGFAYLDYFWYNLMVSLRDSVIFPMIVAFITTLLTILIKSHL